MLNPVCLMMAEDEKNHAKVLTDKLNNIDFKPWHSSTLTNAKKIFEVLEDIKCPIKEIPSQLDYYRIASKLEKKCITLYTALSSKAADDKEKEFFDYLILHEIQHFQVLNELGNLLRKIGGRVLFAEYGVRKEF